MSKWLHFNKTAFGKQIHFHFDKKCNFSFHLVICTSFGGAVFTDRVSRKTFCLQVGLASACSLGCTSGDMFSLLCFSGHKFKTGCSSGAAFPWWQWGLPPPELYIHLRAWSSSRAEVPVGAQGLVPQPPCRWAQPPAGGHPQRSESVRAAAAAV